MAELPADVYLPERLAQVGGDMIIVDAESANRDTLEHVVTANRMLTPLISLLRPVSPLA